MSRIHCSVLFAWASTWSEPIPPQIRVEKDTLEKSLSIKWHVTSTYFTSGVRQQEIEGYRLIIGQKIWYDTRVKSRHYSSRCSSQP